MVQVVRLFNQKYSKQYKNLGFEKNNNSYIRKSNDVLHIFTLKNNKYEKSLDIEFGVLPMCANPFCGVNGRYFLGAGNYYLRRLSEDPNIGYNGWIYSKCSLKHTEKCIEQIGCMVDTYLIPFFDMCKDCKTTLPELFKIEKKIEEGRQRVLSWLNTQDCAQPWQYTTIYDSRKYLIALKSHNANYVRRYFNHMIEHYKKSLTSFKTSSTKQPESVIKNHEKALVEFEQKLDRFNSEGFAYFDKIIEKNEKLMTEILLSKNFTIE